MVWLVSAHVFPSYSRWIQASGEIRKRGFGSIYNRKDKTMKRIRNNDLTHYFFRDHSELPESYLKHCREFFESLGIKTKANELQADKLQATSSKRQADAETNKK
jgi:hypothetical protein